MSTPIPTLKKCEKLLGEPAAKWSGKCYAIAARLVELGAVTGHAVYGHFTGEVHPESCFAERAHHGFIQHGWVILPDGRILDPTRWVFEAKKPYLYVGEDTEYDEGGSRLRGLVHGPPPEYDEDEKQFSFPRSILRQPAWAHVECVLRLDYTLGQPLGRLSLGQVRWLANANVEILQPHAAAVYAALRKLKLQALIPIDNVRKVERLMS